MKRGDLVMCEWEDACSYDPWILPSEDVRQLDVLPSATVGILVSKTKKRVAIAGTVNNQGSYCMVMVIPMGMVTRLVKLVVK